jgi:hypothetical protein
MTAAAFATVLATGNLGTVLTIGTTVLVALLAAGSAMGGFAAFKTGRTNAIAASAVARASEAEATANTWKGRLESVQAEFDAYRTSADHDRMRATEAQAISDHEIGKLRDKVSTLEGVVTARHELAELVGVVSSIGQTVASMLTQIQADHKQQHDQHREILVALGGRRNGDG